MKFQENSKNKKIIHVFCIYIDSEKNISKNCSNVNLVDKKIYNKIQSSLDFIQIIEINMYKILDGLILI